MPPDFKTKYNAIVIQQHSSGTIENYDIKTEQSPEVQSDLRSLFRERAIYAKLSPNTKGAERPKNKADKSSLSVQSLIGAYIQKAVSGKQQDEWIPAPSTPQTKCLYLLSNEDAWMIKRTRCWEVLVPEQVKRSPRPRERATGSPVIGPELCVYISELTWGTEMGLSVWIHPDVKIANQF